MKREMVNTILVIEDDQEAGLVIKRKLEKLPAYVVLAETGEEALYRIREAQSHGGRFDLMVIDMWVPLEAAGDVEEEFGIMFVEELMKQTEVLDPPIPIIFYTNYPSYSACVRAMKIGAADFIPKMEAQAPGQPERSNLPRLFRRCQELLCPDKEECTSVGELFHT